MGRQTTIFDADEVGRISSRFGQIYPTLVNKRFCHCAKCKARVEIGQGFRLVATRGSQIRSGYVCKVCVGVILNSIRDWFYNRYFGSLYPVIEDYHRSLDGASLSQAWSNGGRSGLFAFLCQEMM